MASHAKTIRAIQEEHPVHSAFLLSQIKHQAMNACGCNKISCDICGISVLLQRADKIESQHRITTGYLTGGNLIKSMR